MIQVNKTTIPSLNSDSGYFVNSFNGMIIESGEKVPFENKRIADEIIDNGLEILNNRLSCNKSNFASTRNHKKQK